MNEPLVLGAPLPAFEKLKGTDGKHHSWTEYADKKVIVVVFSCNHCPYVRAYEERMKEFAEEFGSRDVQLVAINANDTKNYPEDDFDGMVKRAREQKFNFPYLRDDDQKIAEAFGATHTPEFFVFAPADGDRRFLLRYRGKMDDNYQNAAEVKRAYLREAVEELLAGREVKEPETYSIGCTIKWRT